MTPAEVSQVVAVVRSAYPAGRFPADSVATYERMLIDLPYAPTRDAVSEIIRARTNSFVPSIGEIRHAVAEIVNGPLRKGEEAWGDVTMKIRRVGRYGTPKFKDPVVTECVRIMNLEELCDSTNDASDRARFCALYESLRDRERTGQVSAPELRLLPPLDPKKLGIGSG